MRVLLDIKDAKAPYLMEILKNLKFVKTKTLTQAKAQFFEELKEAVDEINLVKAGKLKGRLARKLIDEL
ncbi:MAG TPA: hypothetical protein VJY62_23055 [Bacteroidia bacterium]|nr:hypothetical protein [Bacteroidia bacterium]